MGFARDNYMLACGAVAVLEQISSDLQAAFIQEYGYINPDMSIPETLDDIDVDDFHQFNAICNTFDQWMSSCPLDIDTYLTVHRGIVHKEEEALLDRLFDTLPDDLRQTLTPGREVYTVRQRLINEALKIS